MTVERSPRPRALRPAVLAVAVAIVALLAGSAAPAQAADSPSWNDVQNARNNQAAAAELVARIEAELDAAQERSATAATAALDAARIAEDARRRADDAAQRSAALDEQVATAQAEAEAERARTGALASSMYRLQSDGPLAARLLSAADPDDLLDRLGLLDTVGAAWAGRAARAQGAANVLATLNDQATLARTAREDAAAAAERAAADAQSAADAEATAVSELTTQADTLYAQLATLKGTTADLERRYRLANQVAAQPANPAPTSPSPGTPAPPAPPVPVPPSGGAVVVDPAGAREYARGAIGAYGWGQDQFACLVSLWNRESGWRADALNPSSGAYGIPQSLPGDKMASAGADWRTNAATQINWGLSYISGRYGSPCGAWGHSQATGWY
ncbi:hypothetical protein SK224_15620 [Microbacterium sp. BG28]|uniref:aggregation-promoting factor C-terminal-like domain-containing protein n=1 Tax=Microbacterium sp. BG28 TaxID=3097356 RepID=UPI002A5AB3A8|nr:hypothetical protein [Microbacterium sp. BG28]MDY0830563.1 hypothetical protein [Microbacterium sp. BG28]